MRLDRVIADGCPCTQILLPVSRMAEEEGMCRDDAARLTDRRLRHAQTSFRKIRRDFVHFPHGFDRCLEAIRETEIGKMLWKRKH